MTHLPWRQAWTEALYGKEGFYRHNLPADHFRTASQAGAELVAHALSTLMERHGLRRVVEVGAGTGVLLTEVWRRRPQTDLVAVEVRPRPAGLPPAIAWQAEFPDLDDVPTLLLGWELLDVVPVTVAGRGPDGLWLELTVRPDGRQRVGGTVTPEERRWLRRWTPPAQRGSVEVGLAREEFWAGLAGRVPSGLALAVDYGFEAPDPGDGPGQLPLTITGFRDGRQVPPVPDGSCDITSHVRWDSLRTHLREKLHLDSELTTQREALGDLGVVEPDVDPDLMSRDPTRYLESLVARGRFRELTDPAGLGGFGWLLTPLGRPSSGRSPLEG